MRYYPGPPHPTAATGTATTSSRRPLLSSTVTPTPHKKPKYDSDGTRPRFLPAPACRAVPYAGPPPLPLPPTRVNSSSCIHISPSSSSTGTEKFEPTRTSNNCLEENGKYAQLQYNRKKKSLGLLAETFLAKFAGDDDEAETVNDLEKNDTSQPQQQQPQRPQARREIVIDAVSAEMGVERRRVYDVVNILEAMHLVVKRGKNTYGWMGTEHLSRQFALLQHDALCRWPHLAVRQGLIVAHKEDGAEQGKAATLTPSAKDRGNPTKYADGSLTDGNKSLTRLSQLFLQVFLVGFETTSLPDASDLIHGGRLTKDELAALGSKDGSLPARDSAAFQQACQKGLKRKIRRLYDIANVLLSVGLLRKTENRKSDSVDGKRPHFAWNYSLNLQQIRHVYKNMPDYMKEAGCPFTKEHPANVDLDDNIKKQYIGLLTKAVDVDGKVKTASKKKMNEKAATATPRPAPLPSKSEEGHSPKATPPAVAQAVLPHPTVSVDTKALTFSITPASAPVMATPSPSSVPPPFLTSDVSSGGGSLGMGSFSQESLDDSYTTRLDGSSALQEYDKDGDEDPFFRRFDSAPQSNHKGVKGDDINRRVSIS
jgi:E2F/DP family winged-helix DNA-binding domain